MGIKVAESKLHWNYYIALERDLENISRYIEFLDKNFRTYSIELAHLLFASASEVDVIAKSLCNLIAPAAPRKNINDYRAVITKHLQPLTRERVFISRYGLTLDPWSSWRHINNKDNPIWWRAYNEVKHERNERFDQANLKNTLNSLAGLLIIVFYFYKERMKEDWPADRPPMRRESVTSALEPKSSLMRLSDAYYFDNLVV